jgi:asparagine synthase (glutamine-hydrolysing)
VEKDAVAADVRTWLTAKEAKHLEPLAQVSLAELSTYIPDVLLRDADQMAMAHALEVRSPFLDHDLVDFVLGVPDDIKYPHTPKQLLTDALGTLLPHAITHRPKMGFTLPWNQWMREDLRNYCESRIESLAQRQYFTSVGVRSMWQRFLNNDPAITWSRVWVLVVLQEWMETNNVE